MTTTATRWNCSHSRRGVSLENGATPTAPAPFSASITPPSQVSDSASSTEFFGSVFGFSVGTRTENRGPEQAALDDVDGVHVSVTPLARDLPAPRLELLHYHAGTRWPIPRDTASNDIVATHCAVRVGSLDATAAALARRGTPLADHDLMILRGGICAALVPGPDGHRFLVEERAVAAI